MAKKVMRKSSGGSMMKECMKAHPMLHSLGGVGIGLIVAALVPSMASVMIGLVVVVVAVVLEMVMVQK